MMLDWRDDNQELPMWICKEMLFPEMNQTPVIPV